MVRLARITYNDQMDAQTVQIINNLIDRINHLESKIDQMGEVKLFSTDNSRPIYDPTLIPALVP